MIGLKKALRNTFPLQRSHVRLAGYLVLRLSVGLPPVSRGPHYGSLLPFHFMCGTLAGTTRQVHFFIGVFVDARVLADGVRAFCASLCDAARRSK